MMAQDFGRLMDGRTALLLDVRADGIVARVSDFGATLVSLQVPDQSGEFGEVVLGCADVRGYEAHENNPFLGATIGRVANRISGARFVLDEQEYVLEANEGANHLHGGGRTSFDRVLWDVMSADDHHVRFRHVSPDGDAGYPGTVHVDVEYRVEASALHVRHEAVTDRATPLNMTHHAYFNLGAEHGDPVGDHRLRLAASQWTPVGPDNIPTGEIAEVTGTVFDLRESRLLADGIAAVQAAGLGKGFDHNFWLDHPPGALTEAAELLHPGSGRRMVLATTQPCLQVYSGNHLGRSVGRGGIVFPPHAGICLEPQHAPDSMRHPAWPTIVLQPGERYVQQIVYRFDTVIPQRH